MHQRDFLAISVAGTILLGIVANVSLLLTGLVIDNGAAVIAALVSLGLAYVCQSLATAAEATGRWVRVATALQILAAASWLSGFIALL